MRYQDQVVKWTQKSLDDVCRSARAVPTDKLEWVPFGEMRTVLDQMQEMATASAYVIPLLKGSSGPVFDAAARKDAVALRKSYDTLEKCIAEARRSVALLCQAVESVPDEALEREIKVPFAGDMVMTLADLLHTVCWNMTYHLGQINQIQLMLGDKEMH